MKHVVRSLIGAAIGFILFAGLAFVSASAYYRFVPGKWFIDYYYVKADDTAVGLDVQVTVCRKVRANNLRINATRTFLSRQVDGKFQPVGEYQFEAGVEQLTDTNCQPIRIAAKDHPQQAGTYKFVTEADFEVNHNRKVIRYESNEYKLTATPQSLVDEIKRLEAQIEELRKRIPDGFSGLTPADGNPNLDARTVVPLTPAQPSAEQRTAPSNNSQPQGSSSPPPPTEQPAQPTSIIPGVETCLLPVLTINGGCL